MLLSFGTQTEGAAPGWDIVAKIKVCGGNKQGLFKHRSELTSSVPISLSKESLIARPEVNRLGIGNFLLVGGDECWDSNIPCQLPNWLLCQLGSLYS